MTDTPRTGLNQWDSGITQPDIPFNNNMQRFDATVNLSVKSATTAAQPGSPANGDTYILPSSPSGAQWTGKAAGTIAYFNVSWYFFTPYRGMRALVQDTGADLKYTSSWVSANVSSAEAVTALTSGTTVTIDLSLGKNFTLPIGHNVGTLTLTNLAGSGFVTEFDLLITQTSPGGYTFALPASFKALGGSDTTIASASGASTLLSAKTFDNGTTWRYAMQESA